MGYHSIEFVKHMFKQAEDAGVIAEGGIDIRPDMDKDNRFLVHTIYQLFVLREVIHYQEVQKMTALLNALFGCIPVVGAMMTNVSTGGSAILNDFEVHGLVESILGITREFSGGFGTSHLVDNFLRRTNDTLSVKEWIKIPANKQKVVEVAASDLGLTIDELRVKVSKMVSEMNNSLGGTHNVALHEDKKGQGDGEKARFEIPKPSNKKPIGSASESKENNKLYIRNVKSEQLIDIENELGWWEEKGVSKGTVRELESGQVTACLSAFLVNYELELYESFATIRETLKEDIVA